MTKIQKLNVIKCARKDFEVRLRELRRYHHPISGEDHIDRVKKEDRLVQAIRFCNYLQVALKRNDDFGSENYTMLEFIGLTELCDDSFLADPAF